MDMWKTVSVAVILCFTLATVLVAANGCKSDTGLDETKDLESVEIREYQGENLSSVNDFRENSINQKLLSLNNYLVPRINIRQYYALGRRENR